MESDDKDGGRPFTSLAWQALMIVRRLKQGALARTADDEDETGLVLPLPKRPTPEGAGKSVLGGTPMKGMSSRVEDGDAQEPRVLGDASE